MGVYHLCQQDYMAQALLATVSFQSHLKNLECAAIQAAWDVFRWGVHFPRSRLLAGCRWGLRLGFLSLCSLDRSKDPDLQVLGESQIVTKCKSQSQLFSAFTFL